MDMYENGTGLSHLGIPTADLKKTVEFYGMIGFKRLWNNDSVVFMYLGDFVVELYQVDESAMIDGSIDHVALNVKDVQAAYDFAKEKGLEIIPSQSPTGIDTLPFYAHGVSFFTIIGPNREKIEFNQVL